jgi:hypothetical protein
MRRGKSPSPVSEGEESLRGQASHMETIWLPPYFHVFLASVLFSEYL